MENTEETGKASAVTPQAQRTPKPYESKLDNALGHFHLDVNAIQPHKEDKDKPSTASDAVSPAEPSLQLESPTKSNTDLSKLKNLSEEAAPRGSKEPAVEPQPPKCKGSPKRRKRGSEDTSRS